MLRKLGKLIWRFMVIFSFIVNIVLVVVLLVLGVLLFDIKNNIAEPLIGGLYSSFVGLDEATIDWTIPVRDNIPVVLNIPLKQNTIVTLTEPVPLNVFAAIDLPGINAYGVSANVNLTLPSGLQLPVALDLNVPVDERLDVALDVRAVIPLEQTQLHDPLQNLQLVFDPIVRGLWNLPDDHAETVDLVTQVLQGRTYDFLIVDPNDEDHLFNNAWQGFSRTAGVNYPLMDQPVPLPNLPVDTGIVVTGGIPALDEAVRPDVYAEGGPAAVNEAARAEMNSLAVPEVTFDGAMGQFYSQLREGQTNIQALTAASVPGGNVSGVGGADGTGGGSFSSTATPEQYGIVPTQSTP